MLALVWRLLTFNLKQTGETVAILLPGTKGWQKEQLQTGEQKVGNICADFSTI